MLYSDLCEYYEKIDSTPKRLTKIKYISELINETNDENIEKVIFLLQGIVFPAWDERKLGVASKIVIKSLKTSTGISTDQIEKEWQKTGDLGITAENIVKNKQQQSLFVSELTIEKIFENLRKLAEMEGLGSVGKKDQIISELLTSAKPIEARYIVRTVMGDLRVGSAQGTLRDAIIRTYFTEIYEKRENEEKEKFKEISELVQNAYDLVNDFSVIISKIKEKGINGLKEVNLELFKPVNPMLFPKAVNIEKGFEMIGKPAIIEYKYDGFRVQIHKKNDEIKLFTRRLEDVTKQFPDIIATIQENVDAVECILDAEVLGIEKKTGKILSFQNISQRIRRKYDIHQIMKEIPVIIVIFDSIKYEGKSLLNTPFKERRNIINNIIKEKNNEILKSTMIESSSIEESNAFYEKSLLLGNEGIMMKSLTPGYKPGARIGYAVKVKPVLEPVDLIITKAEWGHGKRKGWFTSFSVSCKDESGNLMDLGKVGTGIKELENEEGNATFETFTNMLKPLITKELNSYVEVKPEVIVEIDYEEIQKSNNYNSGYALRFPRIKRIRNDIKEPSHIEDIKDIYEKQRGRDR